MTSSDAGPRWLTEAEQCAWRRFLLAHGRLATALGRQLQGQADLSLADFEVLVALSESQDGRLRPSALGRAVEWEKSRLSHHVARMERRGLVRREECPTDGRGAFVVLTDAGRAAIEAAAPGHADLVRRLVFDGLDDHQVAELSDICGRILERVERLEADSDPCG